MEHIKKDPDLAFTIILFFSRSVGDQALRLMVLQRGCVPVEAECAPTIYLLIHLLIGIFLLCDLRDLRLYDQSCSRDIKV